MGSTHPNPAGFTCRARINLFIWLQISMIQPFNPKHKRNPKRWSKEELKREYTDSRLPLKNWTGVRQRRRYDGLWGAIVTFPRRQPFATNVIVATASAQRRRESPSCVSPKFIIFDYLQMSKAGNYSWQVERRLTPNWGRPKGPWYGKWQPRHWHMYVWPTGCKLRYTSRFLLTAPQSGRLQNQHALHGAMGFHLSSAAASLYLVSEGNSIINHLSLPANSFQAHGKVNGLRNLPLRLPDPWVP